MPLIRYIQRRVALANRINANLLCAEWQLPDFRAGYAEHPPPRHNSCRLHRTKNPGAAMKEISGTLRTIIQGPGSSSAVAA
jgi:hypothetical protein